MGTKEIAKEEKKHIRIQSLADKYKCSREYVAKILNGDAPVNSVLARKIMTDARDILGIFNRETTITF